MSEKISGPAPRRINLGSGKDFHDEWINIDIDPGWQPDAIIDLSQVAQDFEAISLETKRFGNLAITPGTVEIIKAYDVLEHVPDLVSLMGVCLRLLKTGGVFDIITPYDLSYGAWQDPTHVRAFNEKSWLYYTDWFWYLGWQDARFAVQKLDFRLSAYGQQLLDEGCPQDQLIRTPRAVDSMHLILEKISLTDTDQANLEQWKKARSARTGQTHVKPAGKTDQYALLVAQSQQSNHHHAFDDLALSLKDAFRQTGADVPIIHSLDDCGDRIPLIIGAHLFYEKGKVDFPQNSIIFNLEQMPSDHDGLNRVYLDLLKKHSFFDYHPDNLAFLHKNGITHGRLLEIGFSPSMVRFAAVPDPDIDVLFYGSINERRQKILSDLKATGLNVVSLFGVYGTERDAVIARSKLVINIHFYQAKRFEIVRASHLLANRICLVSEFPAGDPLAEKLKKGIAFCPYDDLVSTCLDLCHDPNRRMIFSETGYHLFSSFSQADYLQKALS